MADMNMIRLLNLVINLNEQERSIISTSPEFKSIRDMIAKDGDFIDLADKNTLIKQAKTIVNGLCDYAASHLTGITATNLPMSKLLCRMLTDHVKWMDRPVETAAAICATGNADTTYDVTEGIDRLRGYLNDYKDLYAKAIANKEPTPVLNALTDQVSFALVLTSAVCTFMIAKYGSEVGVGEHFGMNVADKPTDLGTKDAYVEVFEGDLKEGTEDLSMFDHYRTIVGGLEAFGVAGGHVDIDDQTFDQRYLMGVLIDNGAVHPNVNGSEGAVWDKAKAGFLKAFEIVRNGLKAIKENYFDKSLEETTADLTNTVNENKKALNAVKEKDAVLTESAKNGITSLANKTGSDEFTAAVSKLSTVGTASAVIDSLMAIYTKEYQQTVAQQKEFDEIDKGLKELESQTNGSAPADDDKEAISVKKAAISEKSKEIKDKLDALKKALSTQRTKVNAIAKAIRGITPSIFYAKKEEKA